MISDWDDYYAKVDDKLDAVTILIFLLLTITIFTVGCCLLLRIKSNYPMLHKHHGCILWLALLALSVPLSIRSILDFSLDSWNPETEGGAAAYNMMLFFFTDLIPIIFQIGSLVFGFIRNKQVKLHQKKSMLMM